MYQNKFIRNVYHVIEYSDFEDIIKAEYEVPDFSFVAEAEANNDSSYDYHVTDGGLDKWDKEEVENFRKTGEIGYNIQALLDDMCYRGLIDAGRYLIKVSW